MIAGVDIDLASCFSTDYRDARSKFLTAITAAGGSAAAYANALKGPHGDDLAIDLAWFGPRDAGNVLVLIAATHGVEGYTGSAAQLDWLRLGGPSNLPSDTAVLLVHALNPHGFAWGRRVTEEGVDLNRNCLAPDQPPPANPGYIELADALVPPSLDAETLARADAKIDAFRAAYGSRKLDEARSSGQYTHPDGIYYGGTGPTWAAKAIGRIAADYELAARKSVAIIDFHTGLGSYGFGEPICGHRPGEPGQSRCRAWYGESLGEPLLGKSSSVVILGLTQYAWARHVGADKLTFVALEFGTYAADEGIAALRADHWLHARGAVDWADPETQAIKAALKRFYHPDTRDWKEMVILRSRQVIGQALEGPGSN